MYEKWYMHGFTPQVYTNHFNARYQTLENEIVIQKTFYGK